MLNSHLISIQKDCRQVLAYFFLIYFTSCSGVKNIKNSKVKLNTSDYCERTKSESPDERSLIFAAKNKESNLVNCFRNYLKFESNKKQLIKSCIRLDIRPSGSVSFVKAFGVYPRLIPKDFQMCIEQEYWKMTFNGLQLNKSHSIKFPLNFSSI